jgi:hypothetical protein
MYDVVVENRIIAEMIFDQKKVGIAGSQAPLGVIGRR